MCFLNVNAFITKPWQLKSTAPPTTAPEKDTEKDTSMCEKFPWKCQSPEMCKFFPWKCSPPTHPTITNICKLFPAKCLPSPAPHSHSMCHIYPWMCFHPKDDTLKVSNICDKFPWKCRLPSPQPFVTPAEMCKVYPWKCSPPTHLTIPNICKLFPSKCLPPQSPSFSMCELYPSKCLHHASTIYTIPSPTAQIIPSQHVHYTPSVCLYFPWKCRAPSSPHPVY